MDIQPWKVIKEEDISPNPWMPTYKQTVQFPNGKIIDDYYIIRLGIVGTILLVNSNNEILFVRQYKHGAGVVLLELPAGRMDVNDKDPQVTAIRECQEETGYLVKNSDYLCKISPSPTKDTTYVYAYLCRDFVEEPAQHTDTQEILEKVFIPIKDIKKKILDREIIGSDVIAILLIAQLKYPAIFNYGN